MTRPTPTQGAQSEAARVPRVSDADLVMYGEIGYGWRHGDADHNLSTLAENIERVVDQLRETYWELDSSRATIADLERRLAEAQRDNLDLSASGSCVVANKLIDERARADALQAQLTEAEQRAATAWRRGFEACRDAAASIAALHYSTRHWQLTVKQVGGKIADAIRALAPAVPQEGETTR